MGASGGEFAASVPLVPPRRRAKLRRQHGARVAEWQTRRTQNPVPATACEFDSRLGHAPSGLHRSCDARHRRPLIDGLPFRHHPFRPLPSAQGADMATFQWARLKANIKCALRKGAWYRILKLTSADAVLDVKGKPVPVPRGSLQLSPTRSEEHTSELQSRLHLVCRLLLEKKKKRHTVTRRSQL